jgi:putative peptide zinc metalloprotease protein
MQEALLSPYWYRISALHPRLRPHVSVRMQTTRGQAWYVLYNQATGRHHRVNAHAYQLVGRLDGRHSVDEVWQVLLDQQGDEAPSQQDVIRILGQMTDAGLIQAEVTPDVRQMIEQGGERQRQERRARLNPLSFRMGLFNPSMWLERLMPLSRAMWSTPVQCLWLLLVLGAGWAMVAHFREVSAYAHVNFMSPGYLAAAWLIYPLMKGLHELGHALTLRRHGCEVPEVGVNFFLFMPMPFVDASAANRLTNAWQRARISIAGIGVELALAALAALLWVVVEDGLIRQGAFVVMSLGGLSTLLFNGNPLMKLDGYYVLSDVLDLSNLSGRSARLWSRAWQHVLLKLFRLPAAEDEAGLSGADWLERAALWTYAPLAWVYRVGVSWLIVSWAADKASLLGGAVALGSAWALVVKPVAGVVTSVTSLPSYVAVRGRATLLGATVMLGFLGGLFLVPIPSSMVVEGVVWLPEHAQLRAPVDGQVQTLWAHGEQTVQKGQALITLDSPLLKMQREVLVAKVERAEAEANASLSADALKSSNAQADLLRDRQALAQLDADIQSHVVRAPNDGRFVLSRGADLEGREVSRGDLLAYVLGSGPAVVRAVVPQPDIDAIRQRLQDVVVMLDEAPTVLHEARFLREVPASALRLPDPAMGDHMGGRVPTDPRDHDGLKPLEPVYVIDVALAQPLPRTGGLARVRLSLAPQTLAEKVGLRLRQLFLKHFSDLRP